MKMDDIEAGVEYLVRVGTPEYGTRTRVLVLSVDEHHAVVRYSYEGRHETGLRIRAARVRVLSGDSYWTEAYGLPTLSKGKEGLVAPRHVVCRWSEHEESRRRQESYRAEREQVESHTKSSAAELGARLQVLGFEEDALLLTAGWLGKGRVLIDINTLRDLVDRAERLEVGL